MADNGMTVCISHSIVELCIHNMYSPHTLENSVIIFSFINLTFNVDSHIFSYDVTMKCQITG